MQGAERLPLEPHAFGRRRAAAAERRTVLRRRRRGTRPSPRTRLEHTGAAEAERAGLAGCGRRQLRAPADDRHRDGEELVAIGGRVDDRGDPAAGAQRAVLAGERAGLVGEVDQPEPARSRRRTSRRSARRARSPSSLPGLARWLRPASAALFGGVGRGSWARCRWPGPRPLGPTRRAAARVWPPAPGGDVQHGAARGRPRRRRASAPWPRPARPPASGPSGARPRRRPPTGGGWSSCSGWDRR